MDEEGLSPERATRILTASFPHRRDTARRAGQGFPVRIRKNREAPPGHRGLQAECRSEASAGANHRGGEEGGGEAERGPPTRGHTTDTTKRLRSYDRRSLGQGVWLVSGDVLGQPGSAPLASMTAIIDRGVDAILELRQSRETIHPSIKTPQPRGKGRARFPPRSMLNRGVRGQHLLGEPVETPLGREISWGTDQRRVLNGTGEERQYLLWTG